MLWYVDYVYTACSTLQFSWCWIWIFSLQCQILRFNSRIQACHMKPNVTFSILYGTFFVQNLWTCKNVSVTFTVFVGYHPSVLPVQATLLYLVEYEQEVCPYTWEFIPVVLSSYASSVKTGGPSLWRMLPDGVCLAFDTEHWFCTLCWTFWDNNTLTSRRVLFTRQCFFIFPEIICWALHVAELFMFPKAALRLWNS